jgi:hypothetical protein
MLVMRLRGELVAAAHRVDEVEREVAAVEAEAGYVGGGFQQKGVYWQRDPVTT